MIVGWSTGNRLVLPTPISRAWPAHCRIIAPSVDRLGPRLHDLGRLVRAARALKMDPFL